MTMKKMRMAMVIPVLALLASLVFSAAVVAVPALAQTSSSSSSSASANADAEAIVRIPEGASSPNNLQFFIPAQITVQKGAEVNWVNDDATIHTVTSGDASLGTGDGVFDSSILSPGEEFSYTFEAEGTFLYFCTLHPFMTGTVNVASTAADASAAADSSSAASTAQGQQQQQTESQGDGQSNASSGNQNGDDDSAGGSSNNIGSIQTSAEAKAQLYKPAYPKVAADSKSSLTVQSEKHLYKPGEEVKVEGSVWSNLLAQINGGGSAGEEGLVTVQVTDNKGAVVASQDVPISSQGGYSAVFTLPSDAELGAYTVESKVQVKADLLGLLSADLTAKLPQPSAAKFVVASPQAFAVQAEGKEFDVRIASNSTTVSDFRFDQEAKKVSFTVEGETGTRGVTQVTLQKPMLSGQMTVLIDGEVVDPESNSVIVTSDTSSEMTLEINYHHSKHTIEVAGTNVVPEFPVSMAVMAVAIGSIVATVAVAGKRGLFIGGPKV